MIFPTKGVKSRIRISVAQLALWGLGAPSSIKTTVNLCVNRRLPRVAVIECIARR